MSFGQTDDQFLQFNSAIGEVKNSIQDIKAATAFQAKDNNLFLGIVQGANALVGAVGAGQAAITLLGDDSEDTQKKMVQLQSILVIINGLQQVANALETESGVVQTALAAKTALLSAATKVRALLIGTTVTAIQTEVAANAELVASETAVTASSAGVVAGLEGQSVANAEVAVSAEAATASLVGESAAADAAAVSTGAFSSAFIATGIGAVIVAVAAALVYLTSKFADYLNEGRLTTKMQGEILDSLKASTEAFLAQGKIISDLDEVTKRYYENNLALSQAAGANERQLYATKVLLNTEEKSLAQAEVDRLGATNKAYADQTAQVQQLQTQLQGLNAIRSDAIKAGRGIQNDSGISRSDAQNQQDAAEANIDLVQKQLAAVQPIYDAMGAARKRLAASDMKTSTDETELEKFNADQLRQFTLDSIQIRADATKAANDAILNSDRTTQAQRLAAIKSNNAAELSVIIAQRDAVVNNGASTDEQKATAVAKANEAIYASNLKLQQDLYSLNEGFRLRDLAAEDEINVSRINSDKDANDAIVKNENNGLTQRLSAYAKFVAAEKVLADESFTNKLKSAGFNDAEIQAINDGYAVETKGKKITNDELEALEIEHQNKLKDINNTAGKDIYDITLSWAKKQEDAVVLANQSNGDTSDITAQYNKQQIALDNALHNKTISIEDFNAQVIKLQNQYQIDLATKVAEGEAKSLASLEANQDALKSQIEQGNADLDAAFASGDNQQIIDNKAKLDALLKQEQDNNAAIKKSREALGKDETDEAQKRSALEIQYAQQVADARKKLDQTAFDLAKTVGDAQYEKEINQIQDQINAVNAQKDAEIAAENATTDSAADKANKITAINAAAAAEQNALTLEQNAQKKKEAEFDKKLSIAKIIINTAEAVSKDLKLNKALIPFDIAEGALELAIVLAQPIPTYRYGTKDHPGGIAEAGHGRPELVELPTGEMFVTPATPTMYDLPEHTVVYPDANVMLNSLLMRNITVDAPSVNVQREDFGKHAKAIITAINDKPTVVVKNSYLGIQASWKSAKRHFHWVNKNMQSH